MSSPLNLTTSNLTTSPASEALHYTSPVSDGGSDLSRTKARNEFKAHSLLTPQNTTTSSPSLPACTEDPFYASNPSDSDASDPSPSKAQGALLSNRFLTRLHAKNSLLFDDSDQIVSLPVSPSDQKTAYFSRQSIQHYVHGHALPVKSLPTKIERIRQSDFIEKFSGAKKIKEFTLDTPIRCYTDGVCKGLAVGAHEVLSGVIRRSSLAHFPTLEALKVNFPQFLAQIKQTPGSQVELFIAGGARTLVKRNKMYMRILEVIKKTKFASAVSIKHTIINPWVINPRLPNKKFEEAILTHKIKLLFGLYEGAFFVTDASTLPKLSEDTTFGLFNLVPKE